MDKNIRISASENIAEFMKNNIDGAFVVSGQSVHHGKVYQSVLCDCGEDSFIEVRIYSLSFVYIQYETKKAGSLPRQATLVFNSESDAIMFIYHAFVVHDDFMAMCIPTKEDAEEISK